MLGGLGFFLLLGLVLWGVAALVSGGGSKVRVNLGDNVFAPGDASDVAKEVADNGPILFPGLVGQAGRERSASTTSAPIRTPAGRCTRSCRPASPRRACSSWTALLASWSDPCSGRTFPADGTGLDPVPWSIDNDGVLVIDLTPGGEPGQGTTTLAPPTTI